MDVYCFDWTVCVLTPLIMWLFFLIMWYLGLLAISDNLVSNHLFYCYCNINGKKNKLMLILITIYVQKDSAQEFVCTICSPEQDQNSHKIIKSVSEFTLVSWQPRVKYMSRREVVKCWEGARGYKHLTSLLPALCVIHFA